MKFCALCATGKITDFLRKFFSRAWPASSFSAFTRYRNKNVRACRKNKISSFSAAENVEWWESRRACTWATCRVRRSKTTCGNSSRSTGPPRWRWSRDSPSSTSSHAERWRRRSGTWTARASAIVGNSMNNKNNNIFFIIVQSDTFGLYENIYIFAIWPANKSGNYFYLSWKKSS